MTRQLRAYQEWAQRFVIAWQRSKTRSEVAQRLGLGPEMLSTLSQYATHLRTQGVELKKFHKSTNPKTSTVDISLLKAVAKRTKESSDA